MNNVVALNPLPLLADDAVIVPEVGRDVVVPGQLLLSGDYSRSGVDLVIAGEDGAAVLIRGYFASPHPPNLISGDGALISGDLAARLAGPLAPGQYAQASQVSAPEPIGTVETASGSVSVNRSDGTRMILEVGDPVYQGDVLETGNAGSVGIVLADDTNFSLGAKGRVVLDRMIYDDARGAGEAALTLIQGTFSFVSGVIAKSGPEAMTIKTPVATLGIRGTQGGISYFLGQKMTVVLVAESNGAVGEIVISNAGGVQILNQPNNATSIASYLSAPAPVYTMSHAAVTHSFGETFHALPISRSDPNQNNVAPDTQPEDAPPEETGANDAPAADEQRPQLTSEQLAAQEAGMRALMEGASPEEMMVAVVDAAKQAALQSGLSKEALAALAKGAKPEEVFQAAADAAMREAMARGVSPGQYAQKEAQARQAFEAAVAKGVGAEEAMKAAMAAIGDQQLGGKGPLGPGGIDLTGGPKPEVSGPAPDAARAATPDPVSFLGPQTGNTTFVRTFDLTTSILPTAAIFASAHSAVQNIYSHVVPSIFYNRLDTTLPTQVLEADNAIAGTSGNDLLFGLSGKKDLIAGQEGDDYIYGDAPINQASVAAYPSITAPIFGNGYNDAISGGAGNDVIYGGPGNDIIHGDVPRVGNLGISVALGSSTPTGNDVIHGGLGNDEIEGGQGADTLHGGQGDDIVSGGRNSSDTASDGTPDVFVFDTELGTVGGTAGTQARVARLGTDTIRDFETGIDTFKLADSDFGLGASFTSLMGTSGTGQNYGEFTSFGNISMGGTGAAVIVIGASTGSTGVQVWFTEDQTAPTAANSYQIAQVDGVNLNLIADTDFQGTA